MGAEFGRRSRRFGRWVGVAAGLCWATGSETSISRPTCESAWKRAERRLALQTIGARRFARAASPRW